MTLSKKAYATISSYGRALAMALDERDGLTRRHCDRVIELAGAFGRYCNFAVGDLRGLRLTAALHDIGKIGISDKVLRNPGRLEGAEWKEMQTHVLRGERIVRAIAADGAETVALGVRHHHECYDGSGYPDGLAGADIPLVARMVAIADAYDAMASPRPYQKRRSHEEVMNILDAETGRKFDPDLMARFTAMIVESSHRAASA